MQKKTIILIPFFFFISWLVAAQYSTNRQTDSFAVDLLLLVFVGQLYLYTLLPSVWKRLVQRYGTQSIAYIHHVKEKKELVLEHHQLWANRVEVQIEVLDKADRSFRTKSSEHFPYDQPIVHPQQLIVIRYFSIYKKYVVFDALYHELNPDTILSQVVQKRTSTNSSYSL